MAEEAVLDCEDGARGIGEAEEERVVADAQRPSTTLSSVPSRFISSAWKTGWHTVSYVPGATFASSRTPMRSLGTPPALHITETISNPWAP